MSCGTCVEAGTWILNQGLERGGVEMPTGMPHDKGRLQIILNLLRQQEESAGGQDKLPREKLIVKGKADRVPVYRISVDDVAFNKANGRIKAEVLEKEAELGRELEASSRKDQDLIRAILLGIRPDENEKILEDLKKNGQIHPGIITCDGTVINGNRRKAIFEELHKRTGNNQYKYLDVQVLPQDITKRDLWLIEAGIQLSTPQQLDYSPINHLLKLREGRLSEIEINEMAAQIYGVTEERLLADLSRLDLIDSYLKDFLEKRERYYLVKQLNEHFIDLQNILAWAARPRGNIKLNWIPDASDVNELKLVAFYYIRLRLSHWRIRELRDLFATKESWREVKRALAVAVPLSPEERKKMGLPSDAADTSDDGDDGADSNSSEESSKPKTPVEEKDIQEEAVWRDVHEGALKGYYQDAKERKEILRDTERPLALVTRALRIIDAIPADKKKLSDPEIDEVLRQIIEKINDLRKVIRTQRQAKARK